MDKIENITTQLECLERIHGYAWSALGSARAHGPNSTGVRISLGYVKSQMKRWEELGKEIAKEG
jgi:hypothetical protein